MMQEETFQGVMRKTRPIEGEEPREFLTKPST
jgi:hypothetical protein